MGFTQTKDPRGVTVMQVDGQLIVGNRHELKDLVQAALDRGDRRLLVDFSRTGYIDSSGLGALVSISKRVREAGGELRLIRAVGDLVRVSVGAIGRGLFGCRSRQRARPAAVRRPLPAAFRRDVVEQYTAGLRHGCRGCRTRARRDPVRRDASVFT